MSSDLSPCPARDGAAVERQIRIVSARKVWRVFMALIGGDPSIGRLMRKEFFGSKAGRKSAFDRHDAHHVAQAFHGYNSFGRSATNAGVASRKLDKASVFASRRQKLASRRMRIASGENNVPAPCVCCR